MQEVKLDDVLNKFPAEIRAPMKHFAIWMQTDGNHREFSELKLAIQDLTVSQAHTDEKVGQLVEGQQEMQTALRELAKAQKETEKTVKELAEAQRKTEKSLSDKIAAMGSRWGIYNEGTFRATIHGIFREMEGIRIDEGKYGGRQVDVIIRNGEHIMLEITSRMHSKDIDKLYRSADDYHNQTGISPKLMIATTYVSPKLMQKIIGLDRPVEIFSYDPEE